MLTFAELPGEIDRLNKIVETVFNCSAFAPRDLLANYGFNVGVIDGMTGLNTVLPHPNRHSYSGNVAAESSSIN